MPCHPSPSAHASRPLLRRSYPFHFLLAACLGLVVNVLGVVIIKASSATTLKVGPCPGDVGGPDGGASRSWVVADTARHGTGASSNVCPGALQGPRLAGLRALGSHLLCMWRGGDQRGGGPFACPP
jgi:hypothetical protein